MKNKHELAKKKRKTLIALNLQLSRTVRLLKSENLPNPTDNCLTNFAKKVLFDLSGEYHSTIHPFNMTFINFPSHIPFTEIF
jgi:hypothetical protein